MTGDERGRVGGEPGGGHQRRPEHRHDHRHVHAAPDTVVGGQARRAVWWTVAALAVTTVVALVVLWPNGGGGFEDPGVLDAEPIDATVIGADLVPCSFSPADPCRLVQFEMAGEVYGGSVGSIEEVEPGRLELGDEIRVVFFDDVNGERIYAFYDFQRWQPLLLLGVAFAVAVVALGRWRGVGALAGLVVSLLVIVTFTLPAILDGSNSVTVAVVTASVIAFVALFLAHGPGVSTAVALVATIAALVLTAVLAWAFVAATNLTGLTDDSSFLLSGLTAPIDPRGILLAGIVIGSLGVLDDVTVTQVSAVWQLHSVQPDLTITELVRPAMRIGRDHISSTVNTLMLAYTGTALPLMLLFVGAEQGFSEVVTREIVATEIVRTLVGSIGLVASVPIATWLAAGVVTSTARR